MIATTAMVPRLVRISEHREPPPACLAALRALHPRLELVALSPAVWWIGEVREDTAARVEGERRLAQLAERIRAGQYVRGLAWWKAELMRQGFRMLAMLTTPEPVPSACVAAVAGPLRATPADVDRAFEAQMRAKDEERAAADRWLREEYIPRAGLDAHRHAFHRPLHVDLGRGTTR